MVTSEPGDLSRASAPGDGTVQTKLPQYAKLWGLVVALGVLLGVVDSCQSYFLGNVIGVHLPWAMVFTTNVVYWGVFAALVPAVFFLAGRVRLDGPVRYSRIAILCLGGVVFSIAHTALWLGLTVHLPKSGGYQARFFGLIREYVAAEFL